MKRGIYIGRFQPFHLGHLHAVKYGFSKVSELIIGIGSAQYSHTLENPFTAGERFTMVKLALDEAGINRSSYFIIPIPDAEIHKTWVSYVVSQTPNFDIVFSNEALTIRLFKEAGFTVERIPLLNRDEYSATEIRKRILENGDWASLMPKNVVKFMEDVKGSERIIELTQSDKPKASA
jgi:nicotinamide-nucleotide adenylyltransferase